MIAKMNKTDISAKILKSKKNRSFYYQNPTKNYSAHVRGKVFPLKKHNTNPGSGSSSSERHRILAAILDFAEEA